MDRSTSSKRYYLVLPCIVAVAAVGWRLLAQDVARTPTPAAARVGSAPGTHEQVAVGTDDEGADRLTGNDLVTPGDVSYVCTPSRAQIILARRR